jgi:hypothetical protein
MTKEVKEKKPKKSIWKRWWFWVIVIIVVGSVATSGSNTDDTDKITDETSTTETAETTTAAKEDTEEATAPEAEPVKVWEGNGVVIYFKELTSEGVKYLVENNTDKSVTIQADSVAVNGFSVSSNDIMMSADISPKSKGYATAETTELSDAGTPETVSGSLNVIDSDSFNTIANAQFTNVSVK